VYYIRHPEQHVRLGDYLRAFPNVELATVDYEMAAHSTKPVDRSVFRGAMQTFLSCVAACHRNYGILTTDHDFQNFREHIPITLIEN
jgi:hypothetical protein